MCLYFFVHQESSWENPAHCKYRRAEWLWRRWDYPSSSDLQMQDHQTLFLPCVACSCTWQEREKQEAALGLWRVMGELRQETGHSRAWAQDQGLTCCDSIISSSSVWVSHLKLHCYTCLAPLDCKLEVTPATKASGVVHLV